MNRLFYGDDIDVLRQQVADESVALVYLDPPFNSNANYNVLFAERDGTQAASQIKPTLPNVRPVMVKAGIKSTVKHRRPKAS